MIEKIVGYKVGEQFFPTIVEAQEHELEQLLAEVNEMGTGACTLAAKAIIENKEAIMDILTMTPSSRPKARKANGATRKPRKASAAAVNAAVQDTKP